MLTNDRTPLTRPLSRRALSARLLSASSLASISLALLASSTGCDKTSASEDIRNAMDRGTSMVRTGDSEEAAKILQGPANQTAAIGATLQLKNTLGHAKYDQALTKLQQLDADYVDIARLQSEIAQIATSISVGNTLIEGYNKLDPSKARELVKAKLADVQGGPDKKVWIDEKETGGRQPIPTLAAAKQTVSELEQKVAAKQDEIKKLDDERSAALQIADKLRDAVDGLKGNEAVEAFRKASEARKQVSVVSSNIDLRKGELLLLQRDLDVAKGQVAVLENYIDSLNKQDQAIASGQDATQAKVGGQQSVSKQAVAAPADGQTAASLSAKVEQLAAKLDDANKTYTEAEELLKGAQSAYESAASEATKYRTDLTQSIDLYTGKSKYNEDLLKAVRQANWPAAYRIEVGTVLGRLGDLYAGQGKVQSHQEKLVESVTAILQKAGIEVPAKLTAQANAAKTANDAAADAYDKSVKELQDAADSIQQDPEKRKVTAAIAQTFVLYQWAQLLRDTGDTAGADKLLDRAREQRNLVTDASNGAFPSSLPPELALAPAPAGTTPTPAPTTAATPDTAAPTTTPAPEGTAPATEPAPATSEPAPATPAAPANQ